MAQNNGEKYMDAHKRWISQAYTLMAKVPDFNQEFVHSLNSQVEKGKPLTARQFVSLKKVVGLLKFKTSENPQEDRQLTLTL